MAIPQGRTGRIYLKKEAAYGVEEVLASANALRHVNVGFSHSPFQRENSPEKNPTPGIFTRFDRKPVTSLSTLVALLRPSGVLNTLRDRYQRALRLENMHSRRRYRQVRPQEHGRIAGLAIGDFVQLEVTGQANSPYIRKLTNVAGAVLTWAPALPAAQTVGDDVKGCITYKLSTALALSFTIAHYLTGFKRELLGVGIDSFALALDANAEPQVTVSGPARDQLTGTTQAQPGAFTTVGGNPPSGIIGETWIDSTVYLMKSLNVSWTNSLAVRNTEYGVRLPTEIYRNGLREISVQLDAWAETEATLYDKTEAGTLVSVFTQTGRTSGNIVGIYMPKVDLAPPEQNDDDGEVNWAFSGIATESTIGANDECSLALA
jgi:hypothetical protein